MGGPQLLPNSCRKPTDAYNESMKTHALHLIHSLTVCRQVKRNYYSQFRSSLEGNSHGCDHLIRLVGRFIFFWLEQH